MTYINGIHSILDWQAARSEGAIIRALHTRRSAHMYLIIHS